MKKTILSVIAAMVCCVAIAQNDIPFSVSDKASKDFDLVASSEAIVIDRDGDNLLVVSCERRGGLLVADPRGSITVQWTDANLKVKNRVVLENTDRSNPMKGKSCNLLGERVVGDKVVLVLEMIDKSSMTIKKVMIDRILLSILGEEVLGTYSLARGEEGAAMMAESESGEFSAILAERGDDNTYASELIVLDNEMGIQWRRDVSGLHIDQMAVTDEGDIYTIFGTTNAIQCNSITDDNEETFVVNAPKKLSSLNLLNVIGNTLVLGGTYGDEAVMDGLIGIAIDMTKGEITGYEAKPNTAEIYAVINNERIKTHNAYDLWLPTLAATVKTTSGGAMVLTRRGNITTTNANGSFSTTCYQQGIVVVGVNNEGEIAFCHPIRNNVESSMTGYRNIAVTSDGNRIYVGCNEHAKAGALYDIESRAKLVKMNKMFAKSAMAVYTIEGETINKAILGKSATVLYSAGNKWLRNNKYWLEVTRLNAKLVTIDKL